MERVILKTCEGMKTYEFHDGALILPQDRRDVLVEKILIPPPPPEAMRWVEEMLKAAERLTGLAHME